MKQICVFLGSSPGRRPEYAGAAAALGRALAARGLGLVYGGGNVGLMGVLAGAALDAGAEVTGIIPRAMVERELAHHGVTSLRVVESMHERKALMADLADAFVALPGGMGTLEELFEVLTWAQLGIHGKPVGILNVGEYFTPLLEFLDRGIAEGFIADRHRGLFVVDVVPDLLLDRLAAFVPPPVRVWAREGDR